MNICTVVMIIYMIAVMSGVMGFVTVEGGRSFYEEW